MKEGKGNTVLLTIIGIATLLIAVVGATFAYFTAVLSGQETATTIQVNSGTIGTVFEGGAAINVQNIYPRAEAWATKVFSIKGNTSATTTVPYDIALVVDGNTFVTAGALKFTLTKDLSSSVNGTFLTEITEKTSIPSSGSYDLGSGSFSGPTGGEVIHKYVLTIYFPDTGGDQNADQSKTLSAHISINAPEPTTTTS